MSAEKGMSVARGAIMTISMRWTDRLIGVLSTLILARILAPEDFGIIAQASIIVSLLGVLTDFGVHIALIQNKQAEQSHFDTAWTIRLIQMFVVAGLVFVMAPYAGEYFGTPRVVPVLRALTLSLLLSGIENIGVLSFQKEMQFGLDFRFLFLKRLSGFLVTISLAFFWESYWALVVGAITGRAVGVILSYVMHPMRPSFSLSRFREIFSVSQWTLILGIGGFLDNSLDRLILGGRSNSTIVGGYTLADEIASMPSAELLQPLNRVLFPAFVQVKDDPDELKRMFLMAQRIQCLIAIPASIGMSLVAYELIAVLLGSKWLFATPFIQLLALVYIFHAITSSASYVIITLGQIRLVACTIWTQVVTFILLVILLWPDSGAQEIAFARLVSSALGGLLMFCFLNQLLPNIRLREIGQSIARPLLGSFAMIVVVMLIDQNLDARAVLTLGAKVILGAVSYVSVVIGLWIIGGRQNGAETYLLDKLQGLRLSFQRA